MTRPEVAADVDDVDLSDRTVLVTGSTDGIGRETALALARLGADVLVHGRDREKGRAIVTEARRHGVGASFHRADFASLSAVRELADVAADEGVTDLVNNAGLYVDDARTTEEGYELTFGVNHVAPFVLTCRLASTLPARGRIVTTASDAHRGASLDLDRATRPAIDGTVAYRHSKLCNVLFTRELAQRLPPDGPTANCLHPGLVPDSALWRTSPWWVRGVIGLFRLLPEPLQRGPVRSTSRAAATPVFLVAGDVSVAGRYFSDCSVGKASAAGRDDDSARRLWEWSVEATGADVGGSEGS